MKKGFTLIELIAVILILGTIALIAVPVVSNIVKESRKSAFATSANNILESANGHIIKYLLTHSVDSISYPIEFICDGEKCVNSDNQELKFKGKVPTAGAIIIDAENKARLVGITDGTYCADTVDDEIEVTTGTCNKYESSTPESCFVYEDNATGVKVTNYLCDGKNGYKVIDEVRMPSKLGGKSVTEIADGCFYGNAITSIELPDTVTSIGAGAFYGNKLSVFRFPKELKFIAPSAFFQNNIVCLAFNDKIEIIHNGAFGYNKLEVQCNADSMVIPESVKTIDNGAFVHNKIKNISFNGGEEVLSKAFSGNPVERVIFSEKLKTIGSEAFAGSNIKNVIIPRSVTFIGSKAFYNGVLESVTFDEPYSWKVKKSNGSGSATSIDVSFPTTNAELLNSTYLDYDFIK